MERDFLPLKTTIKYKEFCLEWIEKGFTPLFEWCSYRQQIIVSYPEDMLVLTAIRNNATGLYVTYGDMLASCAAHNVPLTKPMKVSFGEQYQSLGELLRHVKETTDLEGFVLCFETGEFYKLKTEWYFARSKKVAGHFTGQEKELWDLILNRKIDDLGGALGAKRTEALEQASMKLWKALERSAEKIQKWIDDKKKAGCTQRKDFAALVDKEIPKQWSGLYYHIFAGADALEEIVQKCKEYMPNRNKLDMVRDYFAEGIKVELTAMASAGED